MQLSRLALPLALIATLGFTSTSARAETGIGLRAGTMGLGVDFDISLLEKLNFRLGYNGLNVNKDVSDTDVNYDGEIKISSFSGLLDWHVAGGGFRLTGGLVGSGPKINVVGAPSGGTYDLGNNTYTASQIGSLRGEIKLGNSAAPYLGVGWGNAVSTKHRVSFLFDLGLIYGGEPDVALTAICGAGVPAPTCAQLQVDVQREIQELKDDVSTIRWYPVISFGIGVRF